MGRSEGVELEGARCLVIGGARRLGREIALDLAAHGVDVAVSTRGALTEAEATCAAIRALGRRAAAVAGDPGVPTQAAALVAGAADALGGLDALVYAASGPFRPAPPHQVELGDWQASFDVIARGFFVTACAAREAFVAPGGVDLAEGGGEGARSAAARSPRGEAAGAPATRGVIVALTDVLGMRPSAAFAGHGAAKAAQIMLVASLARAWGADGVRVCSVAPGPVALPDDPRADATLRAAARTALGRPVGPDDVARAVRFVIGCDAVTGVNLAVDGGALLDRPTP
jgi:hypothetical protein